MGPYLRALVCLLFWAPLTTPAQAQLFSQIGDEGVCSLMGSIGRDAALLRQTGLSQTQAATGLAKRISAVVSDLPGGGAKKQRLASLIGREATGILRLAYSVPVGRTDTEKADYVISAGQYVYRYCMIGA